MKLSWKCPQVIEQSEAYLFYIGSFYLCKTMLKVVSILRSSDNSDTYVDQVPIY